MAPLAPKDVRTVPKKLLIPPYSRKAKNPPYQEHVVEDLRQRMRKGPVTLADQEVERIIAMLEVLSERCGDAYQVVGQLAEHAGMFHDPAVVRALDALARPLRQGEILPFVPKPPTKSSERGATMPKRATKRKSRRFAAR
jgi:hypothetical protein